MRRTIPHRSWRLATVAAAVAGLSLTDCSAIEMFTYFGDGSRIGLPSLEVPIEAYPGIPLRSDRLRARRRAMRAGPGAVAPVGPQGSTRGITIRAMPTEQPTPAVQHRRSVPPVIVQQPEANSPPAEDLVAPEPDDVGLPAAATPPSGS